MNGFTNYPIRTKLILIMVTTGMLTLGAAVGTMVISEYSRAQQTLTDELLTIADVVGANCSAALTFGDRDAADENLKPLAAKSGILAAYLYDDEGMVFSTYRDSRDFGELREVSVGEIPDTIARLEFQENEAHIFTEAGHLHVLRPVRLHGDLIGIIHLVDDQSELGSLLQGFYQLTMIIVVVSLIMMLLISMRMQRVFSGPLQVLLQAMHEVTVNKDYEIRVSKMSSDEFGDLVDMFNRMIAEIRNREQKLAEYSIGLEKKVDERTQQLSTKNEELNTAIANALEARDKAEEASRAKSEFLATMSHEIRTPMNGVLGMAELLTASELPARQAHFAKTIQSSGYALLEVINDILDFSKIESGMLKIDHHKFHLGELMEDVADLMADQASRKGLEIYLDVPTVGRTWLEGDSHRIRQVLVNLIGNAIKFTETGRIVVRVVPELGTAGMMPFTCEIVDTGIGIAPLGQKKIFEAFTQADGSTTRRFGGTGLGLAITKRLVELMGGEMGLHSEIGEGSTFWFRLELPREESLATEANPNHVELEGYNLLVVDDTKVNLEILAEFASSWGMVSAGAPDAEAALAALKEGAGGGKKWDAVLLDLHLPGKDGIDLARDIRRLADHQDTPLLMLSSTHHDYDVENSRDAGINRYLQKPVRKKILGTALYDLLNTGERNSGEGTAGAELHRDVRFQGRVLVAEDNPVNQDVACGMLEILGLEVVVADDGDQAVAAVDEQRFDLVFMDCHMPGMDGFAASTAIRSLEREVPKAAAGKVGRIPIVAMTANVQKDVHVQCLDAGMDGYLSKPFTWEQLIEVLRNWLPDSCQLAEVPTVAQQLPPEPVVPTSNSVLDVSVLNGLRSLQRPGRPDIVQTALEKYFINYDEKCHEILQAIAAGDMPALADASHFLKSSSASLGALALADICRILEGLGRAENSATALNFEGEFSQISGQTRSALENHLGEKTHVT